MTEQIFLRKLSDLDDFRQVVDIQKVAWDQTDLEIIPEHFMLAARDFAEQWGAFIGPEKMAPEPEQHSGGVLSPRDMAGFGLVYPTGEPGVHLFHLLGVRPECRSLGVGSLLFDNFLKVLPEKGGRKLYWTFDPFDLRNAHIYLNKIGGVVTKAAFDYYGPCQNSFGEELPTHRFFCELFYRDADKISFEDGAKTLPIPSNESALRHMETGAARAILDGWFTEAAGLIAEGWLPAGFIPSEDRESGCLVLRKRRAS